MPELVPVAVLAASAAALLALRPVPRPGPRGAAAEGRAPRRRWWLVGCAPLLLVVGDPRIVVLALVAGGVVAGGIRIVGSRGRERKAHLTRARVVELCDTVQAELAAGLTAGAALERAAQEWPAVAPAARACATGGDVPAALRLLAEQPGAAALRVVAAAWQVAHRTGHGLADTLGRVGEDLRAAEQTRRVVAGELASARATSRLLAALPLLALAMGAGAGARPWTFLVGHPVGLACLCGGLVLTYAGLAWIDALGRGVEEAS